MMKHKKSTLSVLFFSKKEKVKKSGLVPLYVRITVDGKINQFNTKLEVEEKLWKPGGATGKSAEAIKTNNALNEIRARIYTLYHELQQKDGYVTAAGLFRTYT